MTQPPAAYIEGYEKARALNPDLADAYVEHTLVGDPLADAAMESLAEFDREKSWHTQWSSVYRSSEQSIRQP